MHGIAWDVLLDQPPGLCQGGIDCSLVFLEGPRSFDVLPVDIEIGNPTGPEGGGKFRLFPESLSILLASDVQEKRIDVQPQVFGDLRVEIHTEGFRIRIECPVVIQEGPLGMSGHRGCSSGRGLLVEVQRIQTEDE